MIYKKLKSRNCVVCSAVVRDLRPKTQCYKMPIVLHWTIKTGPKPMIPDWAKNAFSSSTVALGSIL